MNPARTRAILVVPLLLSSAACSSPEAKPLRPPGLGPAHSAPAAPAPTPSVEQRPTEPTTYDFERGVPSDPGALAAPSGAAPAAPAQPVQAAPSAPRRDLANELSNALAGLSSCVDVAKAAQQPDGKLTIAVSTTVLASGSLGRPEVSAPGQPESALRCLNQQVANLRLPPDVPGAPQRISASTTIQVKAVGSPANAAQPANAAPPPAPTNPDVARPEPTDLARPDPPDLAGPP